MRRVRSPMNGLSSFRFSPRTKVAKAARRVCACRRRCVVRTRDRRARSSTSPAAALLLGIGVLGAPIGGTVGGTVRVPRRILLVPFVRGLRGWGRRRSGASADPSAQAPSGARRQRRSGAAVPAMASRRFFIAAPAGIGCMIMRPGTPIVGVPPRKSGIHFPSMRVRQVGVVWISPVAAVVTIGIDSAGGRAHLRVTTGRSGRNQDRREHCTRESFPHLRPLRFRNRLT